MMTDICGVFTKNIMKKHPKILKIEIDKNPIDYNIYLEVEYLIKKKLVHAILNEGL